MKLIQINKLESTEPNDKELVEINDFNLDEDLLYSLLDTDENLNNIVVTSVS